jgi:acyl-CoA thioester hydrolase
MSNCAQHGTEQEDRRYRFHHPLRVRYVEVDSQGHVFFGHYLTYFDVALVEYLHAIGYSYQGLLSSGLDMFYAAADCQYRGRARFEDDLHVHARIGHIGNTSFTFQFAIYRQAADELIATGKVVAVAVDRATEVPTRVPDALRDAVANYEHELVC